MKSKEMIEQIREMKAKGHSIKKIMQALSISRNTVRKYIRSDNHIEKQPLQQTDSPESLWAQQCDWESICLERKKGVSVQRLYEEQNPDISYSRFARVLRAKLQLPAEVVIPLDHIPGERTQIDYADGLWITDPKTGVKKKSQLFCGVLPFSAKTFAEFSDSQKLPSFIRSQKNRIQQFELSANTHKNTSILAIYLCCFNYRSFGK